MKFFTLLISTAFVNLIGASEQIFSSDSNEDLYISPQRQPVVVSDKEIIFRHNKKLLTFPAAKTKKWKNGYFLVKTATWEKYAKEKLAFNNCKVTKKESSKFKQGSKVYFFQGPKMECSDFFIPEIKNIQSVVCDETAKRCQTFTKGE